MHSFHWTCQKFVCSNLHIVEVVSYANEIRMPRVFYRGNEILWSLELEMNAIFGSYWLFFCFIIDNDGMGSYFCAFSTVHMA